MKTIIIVLFALLFSIKGESQELLNRSKQAISEYSKKQNANLVIDQIITGIGDKPYHSLVYSFNPVEKAKNGVYQMIFDLIDNKCFRYLIAYSDNSYRAALIKKFNAPGSHLKKENDKLVWKNDNKKFEIRIADTRRGNVKAAMFMLVISKI